MIRLFLRKNDISKNAKLPYFTLSLPPETDGGEWKEIGVFWKAKTGSGYSGFLSEGVELDATKIVPYKKPSQD